MDREVQVGKIYRHFKGNYYRVILIAKHTETGEKMVVYQALSKFGKENPFRR